MPVQDTTSHRTWWSRPGLEVREGRLTVAGRDAEEVARAAGTPVYAHDLVRVEEQATALRDALDGAGVRGLVRLALKAQREPPLLRFVRERTPFVGMDVCSPGEVEWALANGWSAGEISYTGTNVSARDLERILSCGVHINVDLLTQLERVGRAAPGRAVGIRVDPGIGAARRGDGRTLYTGPRPTKFGILPDRVDEAVAIASRHDLSIDTVHVHVGDGYLTDGLETFEETVRRVAEMVTILLQRGCPIAEVNTGGGLGVPLDSGEEPLDVELWAAILARHLGPFGVTIATEPGDFLVKECATHLAEVVTVEDRQGTTFVGLDTGWNVICDRFVYGTTVPVVLCRAADAAPTGAVTVTGNINEGDDLFAEDLPFPDVREGDVVAMLGVGSYNGSMTSEHCLREPAGTVFFDDRAG